MTWNASISKGEAVLFLASIFGSLGAGVGGFINGEHGAFIGAVVGAVSIVGTLVVLPLLAFVVMGPSRRDG
jgi:hypothetical protein